MCSVGGPCGLAALCVDTLWRLSQEEATTVVGKDAIKAAIASSAVFADHTVEVQRLILHGVEECVVLVEQKNAV